ncbi:hypothetical protein CEUSTIGMA_g5035.t1 [Chlamydomonas eustigma]|uniref:DNA topoisomerase 2 n=1 Tax=Chlamydomonas eustigma TaxID=1157962 RepID=A0A250X3F9_9CHLO|nr:hypothetical protein CEUSTIGMA_g5035.t1 [Chlamydomonas eustigma]|eukprot:GAX77591.1 hypothetical protein CEUSTIGMA_g5035.t1 [Chlamydomonas eustigma]
MDSDEYENSPSPLKVKKGQKQVGNVKPVQPFATSQAPNVHAGKALEEIYQKKTQLEHILLRPDTYIGSTEKQQQQMWVHDGTKMSLQQISYVPGLYKIFDEILVNAADNKVRDSTMDTIKVDIDVVSNTIQVWNNGFGVPVDIHKEEGVYIPEMIFGHLLTSSNYDDNEKKVTGGRNGYGAKLANIFSTQFVIETCDGTRQRRYKQVFRSNMSVKEAPKISSCKPTENWTCVSFQPDLAKFGMDVLEEDAIGLMRRRVYDLAGILGKGVKVFLNGLRLPVKNFSDYVDMYLGPKENGVPRIYERFSDRWEVCVSTTEGQFQQVSFVNSICTYKGGTHVNYILDQVTKALLEKINKKNKNANVKQFMVKNHVWIFLNCSIENPAFDSQTKDNLTLRASSFGSKCEIPQPFIDKVAKCGIVDHILNFANFRNNKELKKSDGAKRARLTGIPKLDDANEAGTKSSNLCTLILTEGDSAKSLAISGLSIVGRDHYGVFPLRGKLLNVREANAAQISANVEIQNLKQILGLQHGKVYEDVKSLRYGHLMIMTDQDHDGSHIKGLIMNFLHSFFPALLKLPGFLLEFITPIVKASKGSQTRTFYTMPQYESWKESLGGSTKGWKIKYYKGLGTSTSAEAKEYFAAIDRHRKEFVWLGDGDGEAIEMAFSKKKIEERKAWLTAFEPGTFLDMAQEELSYQDFVNKELILFSRADLERSIPNVMDGLKPGQRKIMFASFKKKLYKEEVKVGNLAGYVSDNAAYHHGEASLAGTIVGMAQDFVGSNNINLLYPSGMFGTRRQGGKDAASPRYIYTKLSVLARHLFNEADDQLLNYLNEDGQKIEPEWYIPIVPTVLINGAEGIGTGWSTYVPNYNPRDVIDNIKRLLNGEGMVSMHPWYRGFAGSIAEVTSSRRGAESESRSYQCSGVINQLGETTLEVTELPIRKWTQDYKEWLETLIKPEDKAEVPLLIDYKEAHTDQKVHFIIELAPNKMQECLTEGLMSKFKLNSKFSTSNMVLFDKDGHIKHYSSPEQIIQEFYDTRLEYYEHRRQALIKVATADLTRLSNMVRFILAVIAGSLKVSNRKKCDVLAELAAQGFDKLGTSNTSKKVKVEAADPDQEGEDGEDGELAGDEKSVGGGYNYLLSMPIFSLTLERVQKLQAEAQQQAALVEELTAISNRQMWARDLDAFMEAYEEWEAELAAAEASQARAQLKARGKAKTTAAKGRKAAAASKGKKKAVEDSEDEEEDADDFDTDEDEEYEQKMAAKPKPTIVRKALPSAGGTGRPTAPTSSDSTAVVAPALAVKPKPVPASKKATAAQPPQPPQPAAKPADSEPLSLAARLAGRFQKLAMVPAASTASASMAAPTLSHTAATAIQEEEEDIMSPAPAVTKKKAVAAVARHQAKGARDQAPKPQAVGPAPAKASAANKRKPRGKKILSSDDEDQSEDEASEDISEDYDEEEDVFDIDAPSPAIAPKGKKTRMGPSPLHMKAVAKTAAAAEARQSAAAVVKVLEQPAGAATSSAASDVLKKPAVPAAKAVTAQADTKKNVMKSKKVTAEDSEDGESSEEDANANTRKERRVAAVVDGPPADRPVRARKAAPVSYIEIEDSDSGDEEEEEDSDFDGEEED